MPLKLKKKHVQGRFFDSNCVEMGVKAVETKKTVSFKLISGWCQLKSHVASYSQNDILQNDIKLVLIEKSRDELFTSGKANIGVYVI